MSAKATWGRYGSQHKKVSGGLGKSFYHGLTMVVSMCVPVAHSPPLPSLSFIKDTGSQWEGGAGLTEKKAKLWPGNVRRFSYVNSNFIPVSLLKTGQVFFLRERGMCRLVHKVHKAMIKRKYLM